MDLLQAFWEYLALSGPYLIFGLLISGLIKVYINAQWLEKQLGQKNLTEVFKASLFGIPLPLCSCSVLPTAVTLKKSGASNAATSSFLISTPESGIDSIVMTYGLMDLPMTIIRPIAAFLSAIMAGSLQLLFNSDEQIQKEQAPSHCCSKKNTTKDGSKLKKILKFSFIDLLDDIAGWLAIGLITGSLISFYIPDNFFQELPQWQVSIAIFLIGIPLYICASASTPIAASFVAKGMSPGLALIFLLVGPATNLSSIFVLQKYIGKKGVIINLFAIILTALIMGILTHYLYLNYFPLSWKIDQIIDHEHLGFSHHFCGALLLLLITQSIIRRKVLK